MPAEHASSQLMKAARSGVARSRPAIPPGAVGDTSALAAAFGAVPSESASELPAPAAEAPLAPGPEQIQVPATAAAPAPAADIFARLKRFSAPESASVPAPAAGEAEGNIIERVVRAADGGASVKKAMAGAKVLTPLVASIAFAPGSHKPEADRRRMLTRLLVATQRIGSAVADEHAARTGKPVPQWIVTQLMTAVAEQIGKQVEKKKDALSEDEVHAFGEGLRLLAAEHLNSLRDVVESAAHDVYEPCQSVDDARSRLAVTVASCAWRMNDWVTHESLSLDPRGERPTRFFTYGQRVDEIVDQLLRTAVDLASSFVVDVRSADLRVAHLQASVNRFTQLVGAEYVTRTRAIMNWIADKSISDEEYAARQRLAIQRFPSETLPKITEWARSYFVYIEQQAAEVADGLHETLSTEPTSRSTDAA